MRRALIFISILFFYLNSYSQIFGDISEDKKEEKKRIHHTSSWVFGVKGGLLFPFSRVNLNYVETISRYRNSNFTDLSSQNTLNKTTLPGVSNSGTNAEISGLKRKKNILYGGAIGYHKFSREIMLNSAGFTRFVSETSIFSISGIVGYTFRIQDAFDFQVGVKVGYPISINNTLSNNISPNYDLGVFVDYIYTITENIQLTAGFGSSSISHNLRSFDHTVGPFFSSSSFDSEIREYDFSQNDNLTYFNTILTMNLGVRYYINKITE